MSRLYSSFYCLIFSHPLLKMKVTSERFHRKMIGDMCVVATESPLAFETSFHLSEDKSNLAEKGGLC